MSVSYVYAIIRSTRDLELVPGIDGIAVRVVEADPLAALVSSVDADVFTEDAVREQLSDLSWVERVARAHDAVIDVAARQTTTIPLRLGTTCHDDEAVAALLADLAPAALRTFDHLDGRLEWGVQVFAPQTSAATPLDDESGASFLRRRAAELRAEEQRRQDSADIGDEVFSTLAASAVDATRHHVQDPRLRADRRSMVLNAAFLVAREGSDDFRRQVGDMVARYGEETITLTGPWAPYSFAELDST